MGKHGLWSIPRISAVLLILGSLALFVAVGLYAPAERGLARGADYHTWERALVVSAVILTAIGFVLLEDAFEPSNGRALARIGAGTYFFAGVLVVGGEALAFTLGWEDAVPLIMVYDILAYVAQVSIGGALVQSRIVAPWVGWTTIIWNLGWLLALVILGWVVGYIPLLHHMMPFLIGIALLRKRD